MSALLEHTSDLAIQAEGYSLEELFSNALWQMNELLLPGYCEATDHYDCHIRIQIEEEDPTVLLIEFLSEALTLTYLKKALFCYAYFEVLNQKELAGNLFGRWYGKLENEIRAVTYHEAQIRRGQDGQWGTPVLFDR
ncbi:MAG: archease [Robiginitalea sp.]